MKIIFTFSMNVAEEKAKICNISIDEIILRNLVYAGIPLILRKIPHGTRKKTIFCGFFHPGRLIKDRDEKENTITFTWEDL